MSNEITYRVISKTVDTDDPVIRIERGESILEAILDTQDNCINVWQVESREKGDMKAMLDDLVSDLPTNTVKFLFPLDDEDKAAMETALSETADRFPDLDLKPLQDDENNIEEVLSDYERVQTTYQGQAVEYLETTWHPASDQ